jgi:hypothetical protein
MANFIIAAKKKNGFDYEPTSLRGIISSIDRKLLYMKLIFREY